MGSAALRPCPSVPLAPVAATADTTADATADADPEWARAAEELKPA